MSRTKISKNLARVKPGTLHAGIDLGLEENVVVVIDEQARQIDRFHFRNDLEGYERFKQRIKQMKEAKQAPEVSVAMEPTNMLWKLLANYFEQHEMSYRLVNAYTVKKHREGDQIDRSKDDRRDAFTIADLSRTGKYTETQLQHGGYAELRAYISLDDRLRRQIRREKQYIWNSVGQLFPELWQVFKDYSGQTAQAMLKSCASAQEIQTMNEDEFIARVRQEFEGYRLYQARLRQAYRLAKTSVGVRHGIRGLQLALRLHVDTLLRLGKQQEQVREAIESSFSSLPEARYLLSVKGIGMVSGATILAEIGDPKRYRNARQLVKLAGIQPTPNRSGKKRRSPTPMSHQGRPRLRGVLYLVCLRLIQDDQRFAQLYRHLQKRKSNPLTKMQAIGVLMNKLLHVLWALMKQQTVYDPLIHQNQAEMVRQQSTT
jgi:transposase